MDVGRDCRVSADTDDDRRYDGVLPRDRLVEIDDDRIIADDDEEADVWVDDCDDDNDDGVRAPRIGRVVGVLLLSCPWLSL